MLDSCTRPDLITEITLQPLRRYDVDAAILYSDIVVPLRAIGIDVDIKTGIGPVVATPVRTPADLERLRPWILVTCPTSPRRSRRSSPSSASAR